MTHYIHHKCFTPVYKFVWRKTQQLYRWFSSRIQMITCSVNWDVCNQSEQPNHTYNTYILIMVIQYMRSIQVLKTPKSSASVDHRCVANREEKFSTPIKPTGNYSERIVNSATAACSAASDFFSPQWHCDWHLWRVKRLQKKKTVGTRAMQRKAKLLVSLHGIIRLRERSVPE